MDTIKKIIENYKKSRFIINSLCISVLTFLVIGVLFLWHRDYSIDYPIVNDAFGQFGDFIGGIVGTFFAFISVCLIYRTLHYQKESIEKQSKEFEKQQIETHFFELLKIHRENTNSIQEKYPTFFEDSVCYLNEFFYRFIKQKRTDSIDYKLVVATSYLLFYYGSSPQSRNTITTILKKFTDKYYLKVTHGDIDSYVTPFSKSQYLQLFSFAKKQIENNNQKENRSVYMSRFCISNDIVLSNNSSDQYIDIPNNEPILGTYFRHLYQTVKYINEIDEKIISFDEKYNYVKTLRAQLSSYEQALLFWDSVSPLGYIWELEEKSKEKPDENKFLITRYNLLKNIPDGLIFKKKDDVQIEHFYPNIKWDWKK